MVPLGLGGSSQDSLACASCARVSADDAVGVAYHFLACCQDGRDLHSAIQHKQTRVTAPSAQQPKREPTRKLLVRHNRLRFRELLTTDGRGSTFGHAGEEAAHARRTVGKSSAVHVPSVPLRQETGAASFAPA